MCLGRCLSTWSGTRNNTRCATTTWSGLSCLGGTTTNSDSQNSKGRQRNAHTYGNQELQYLRRRSRQSDPGRCLHGNQRSEERPRSRDRVVLRLNGHARESAERERRGED